MRLNGRTMFLPLGLVFTTVAGIAISADSETLNAAPTLSPATAEADARAHEMRRIHAHFDSVLLELNARDVSTLSSNAITNRGRLVQTLTAYNARSKFPHNYDFSAPTPYFVDRKTGVLCAVAHLLQSTGRRDIVNRVAESNNNVWVAALSSDTAFTSWLAVQGITLDEAARIQVPYMGDGSNNADSRAANEFKMGAYVVGAPLALGTALAAGTWNAWGNRNGHNRLGTYAGVASSLVVGALGAQMMAGDGNARGVKNIGGAAIAMGTVGLGLATRAILQRPHHVAALREQENARRANVEASISPIIPMGKNSGAGLSMNIRF